MTGVMRDSFGRDIRYMRVSVTDRCNLRCRYCMPKEPVRTGQQDILTDGEIARVCRIAAGLGITRFKLTGGEPLLRPLLAELVARLKETPSVEQVTMTSNGVLLCEEWDRLFAAGLDAVNVSLDTADRALYERITGFDRLQQVLDGIDRAVSCGAAVRINAVLQRGVNDDAWRELILFAKDRPIDVRFIELMPIGMGAKVKGVSNTGLFAAMKAAWPSLKPDGRVHGNGPAVYWRIDGFAGSVGFISAMHGPFCGGCNRIRMTARGELRPCLGYEDCVSLRDLLRSEKGESRETDDAIARAVRGVISSKPRMHCFEDRRRTAGAEAMVQIGG